MSAIDHYKLEQTARSGANWFYWIAALSLINSLGQMLKWGWGMIAGLGITQVFDALAVHFSSPLFNTLFAIADIGVVLVFIAVGYAAHRKRTAFIVGMAFYSLDAVIFIWAKDWLSFAFHVFILYLIFNGYKAFSLLEQSSVKSPEQGS